MSELFKDTLLKEGHLEDPDSKNIAYQVLHGWNPMHSLECNSLWSSFNMQLFENLRKLDVPDHELGKILSSLQVEDHHWDWFNKSRGMQGDEYEWFFTYAEGKPQGACVIYHPRASKLSDGDIFYVEFFAVAPWNRTSRLHERQFRGVGTLLLRAALAYSIDVLMLKPGFALHSLPQAVGYYERLRMVRSEDHDKDVLIYFELPEHEAKDFLGAV
jgi:hypothetical protein